LLLMLTAGCGSSGTDSTSTTSKVPGSQIIGSWSGRLHQKGLQPFKVSANIRDLRDPAKNTVHYTGIDCSGNWTYLGIALVNAGGGGQAGATSHSLYRFRQRVDRGSGAKGKGLGPAAVAPFPPG